MYVTCVHTLEDKKVFHPGFRTARILYFQDTYFLVKTGGCSASAVGVDLGSIPRRASSKEFSVFQSFEVRINPNLRYIVSLPRNLVLKRPSRIDLRPNDPLEPSWDLTVQLFYSWPVCFKRCNVSTQTELLCCPGAEPNNVKVYLLKLTLRRFFSSDHLAAADASRSICHHFLPTTFPRCL
jgi:hypothetical protein